MKQTQRVFLECVGEIRQIYKATNVMIKCGGGGLWRRKTLLSARKNKEGLYRSGDC